MENLDDTFSDLASFSLSNMLDDIVDVTPKDNYSFIFYLSPLLLLLVVGGFIYKFYINKKRIKFSENINKNDDEKYHKIP
jgi:hypothetical protein